MTELENKAKEMHVHDLRPFYQSSIFKNHGMSVNYDKKIIIKSYLI